MIYRQQLVDFSDQKLFQQSLGQLVSGLKNVRSCLWFFSSPCFTSQTQIYLRRAEKKKEEEKISEAREAQLKQLHRFVLISYSLDDEAGCAAVQLFKRFFPPECGVTLQMLTTNTSRQAASELLLGCWVLLVVLSNKSVALSAIRDHIALAENHRKLIFPVLASQHIEYDAAMMYTLAQAPKYDLSQPDSPICMENAKLLISVILQNENIAAMTLEIQDLKNKTDEAEKKLITVNDTLEKIYTFVPKERPVVRTE